jgi:hypothetical protein
MVAKKSTKSTKKFVLVRTYSAGVHFGILKSRKGKEVVLVDTQRIWYWKGAASLSQIAVEGVKNPAECKFSLPVIENTLTEAIEVILCSKNAEKNLRGVPVWKM